MLSPNKLIVPTNHFMKNLIEDFTLAKKKKKKKKQIAVGFKINIF
jgi:hypothetical protein